MPKAEGRVFNFEPKEAIRPDFLEPIPFEGREELIRIETEEFSAVCPFSGLPDIGRVVIEYFPDGGKIVELKSLKYYFVSFRNVGIYQEEATKRIYEDLKKLLETERLKVTITYNIRGGFLTTTQIGSLGVE
ncbi:MAG TPA: NADPH-dependent 7-cyano-7-deazaguanine reductase QueF [Thermodesulforhabdus norvegica]|uniref:NADPH-dependent 7-cyano-7-deazaguanine reductase n=1 Tax=Thermodesulforhabdus norvegica TaxID=39841 RepID=A0A7C1AW60_9BACT|nr:NADPH-dependent 7-cyano-7-deazaguanine reductase QueF [Deltaproteobacteria bacterium]MBW2067996.1 NADPH-dependent 7-cyano-7-deazaguanine reductase QueF [Deltaproteobacteria bacterium]HDL89711.1 NADPH-dependent 7-cyano-7-deazaguanine reductase QueF [Thermodesulforhabdus norvegica]